MDFCKAVRKRANKQHQCYVCNSPVAKKQHYIRIRGKINNQFKDVAVHEDCFTESFKKSTEGIGFCHSCRKREVCEVFKSKGGMNRLKAFALLFIGGCFAFLFSFGVINAQEIKTQIWANYEQPDIYVNGELKTLEDEHGNEVKPFIVDGTTFIPIRGISQVLGYPVEWDESGKVLIGEVISERNQEARINNTIESISKILNLDNKVQDETIKAVHDYLVTTMHYDINRTSIYDAIIYNRGNCISYSEAFNRILLANGIKSQSVYAIYGGEGHVLNRVEFSDGWFFVDVTWNDYGNGRINYDYYKMDLEEAKTHYHLFGF
jgi:hypothetical protein